MDRDQIVSKIEKRIDKLEKKIDAYFEKEVENHVDIRWIKGYIRISILALLSLGAGLIPIIFKLFIK